jgi:hypothetical protein
MRAGDHGAAGLADEFTSPQELLGGKDPSPRDA